ncbi:IS66 family transposase [Turicibacter sanguinis]|uniref:IS66 family transposase n=1 Tax=Turicibacter sanguinis TaxID=154288 RepID=UPI0018A8979D|nr:IS66 family transposase [Turicibacter sanguinis]MDB8559587.1 IS66 family transposase [Turicibacter sanguinis]MDB8561040.1 IS66 family transposase [Turicibacter sanguinis]
MVTSKYVYYHSDLTRPQEVTLKLLKGFKGILQCNGYVAYKNLPHVTLAGCWAHCRRYLYNVTAEKGKAKIGLDYCNQIFDLERSLKDLEPEERQKQRQVLVRPVVEAFYTFISGVHAMKGKLQTAVTYAFNQKEELMAFLDDGRLEASNNIAEQVIKSVVIGRKNHLFSTSVKGAEANAIAYTLIETAKANGLNAYEYLTYLFEKLPNWEFLQYPDLLKDFLPWAKTIQETCKEI